MLKPFLTALVGVIVIVILKAVRPELALSVRLCIVTGLFIFAVSGMETVSDYINTFLQTGGIDVTFVKLALKTAGICIVTQTAADTCRDCAETALAAQIELVGRFLILGISLPVVRELLEISIGLIK